MICLVFVVLVLNGILFAGVFEVFSVCFIYFLMSGIYYPEEFVGFRV